MGQIYEKSDFYNAAMSELQQGEYPELAARVAVGDVTITQQMGAIAHMLAMLSFQLGMAEVEPWIKARDNMVLADAAARGVLPLGKAAVYAATVVNRGAATRSLTAGRRLLDNKGQVWVVKNGASVDAGQNAQVQIEQFEARSLPYAVDEARSFYRLPVPLPESGKYLLDVAVRHADGEYFQRAERFNNVAAGERVYHLLADEMMNVFVQFGLVDKAGYIPAAGETLTLELRYTAGDVRLNEATPLDLEYTEDGEEYLDIVSAEQIQAGAVPFSIDELREICGYPSLYDENAVFLGEFAFLLQRHLSPFVFLNVWNERQEEIVRGASLDNINTLFVSFLKDGMATDEAQTQIRRIIARADNSYKVRFVAAVERHIDIDVRLFLAPMHDEAAVRQKITLWLLGRYGRESAWARKGGQRINWQQTVKGLRESIAELQDGISDVSVTVPPQSEADLPEHFRFVSPESIHITAEKLA